MAKLRVLLCCGGGMSTGFLATSIRKAAKAKGLELEINARSESEVENYIDDVDLMMVGPHRAYLKDDLEKEYPDNGVKFGICDKSYYSSMDGEAALEHFQKIMEGK
jgi:PTS system cellobiose-specific IIB component